MKIIFLQVLQFIILIWITQVPLCQTSVIVTTGKRGDLKKNLKKITWFQLKNHHHSPRAQVLLINNYSCILFSNKKRRGEIQENVDISAFLLSVLISDTPDWEKSLDFYYYFNLSFSVSNSPTRCLTWYQWNIRYFSFSSFSTFSVHYIQISWLSCICNWNWNWIDFRENFVIISNLLLMYMYYVANSNRSNIMFV